MSDTPSDDSANTIMGDTEAPKQKSKRGGWRPGAGRKKAASNRVEGGQSNSAGNQTALRESKDSNQSAESKEIKGSKIEAGQFDVSPNQHGGSVRQPLCEGREQTHIGEEAESSAAAGISLREALGSDLDDGELDCDAVFYGAGQTQGGISDRQTDGNRNEEDGGSSSQSSGGNRPSEALHAQGGERNGGSSISGSEHAHDDQSSSGSQNGGDESVTSEQQRQLFDPGVYCSLYCREPGSWRYSPKQLEFLRSCRVVAEDLTIKQDDFPRNIALGAVNGVGKTQIIADLIRYLMDTIPNCGVGFTSHVQRQCEMLERYLQQHQLQPRFANWKCVSGKLEEPNGNFARWFTAKDVGAVESLHAPFMVRILDEVKSMKDEIIDATNRWQPKLTIFISSKGLMSGRFYDCFTQLRQFWRTFEINAYDCPWIPGAWIEEQVATHGINSALVKSMITNEFSDVDLRVLITIEAVNEILRHEPQWEDDRQIVAGLDVSAAKRDGDECVMVHRQGNKVKEPWSCPPSDNEMEVVGRVMNRIREVKPHHLFIDRGGSGGPVAARIAEIIAAENGITTVHRVGFGDKANDERKYARKNAEMYGVLSAKVTERKVILPNHAKLIGQITSRQYTTNSQGQIVLESKETMRRRGAKSPDYADALVMCMMEPNAAWSAVRKTRQWYDDSHAKELRNRNTNGVGMVGGKYLGRG